jgi:hypothetical protein
MLVSMWMLEGQSSVKVYNICLSVSRKARS